MTAIHLHINGAAITDDVAPRLSLADFLRERRNLTGTHLGCEHGVCGACTVLVDGEPVRSCLTLAVACDQRAIETIEGFAGDRLIAVLRRTFHQRHALQCGFCTPGMILAVLELLRDNADPSDEEMRVGLSGNLCMCTGYVNIVRAVRAVAQNGNAK